MGDGKKHRVEASGDAADDRAAPPAPDEGAAFTAGDVGRATGLSYRQINDWDSRGLLPSETERESSWRRFSPRDIFTLMVLAELRREFNASNEGLRFVRNSMTQEGANHLQAAAELMVILGVEVWLMTDFKETFVMDSELEFTDLWAHGFFGGPTNAFAFVKVSPLVNRLFATLKEPLFLPSHGAGRKLMADIHRASTAQSQEELRILRELRDPDVVSLEILMKDGSIERINRLTRPDPTESLRDLLRAADYQKITIHRKDGRTVAVQREESIKP
ncbi:MAG: MerR family transcriptional regulator [Acidimicrobiales bacterium]